jgi:hypothetical protein
LPRSTAEPHRAFKKVGPTSRNRDRFSLMNLSNKG